MQLSYLNSQEIHLSIWCHVRSLLSLAPLIQLIFLVDDNVITTDTPVYRMSKKMNSYKVEQKV